MISPICTQDEGLGPVPIRKEKLSNGLISVAAKRLRTANQCQGSNVGLPQRGGGCLNVFGIHDGTLPDGRRGARFSDASACCGELQLAIFRWPLDRRLKPTAAR